MTDPKPFEVLLGLMAAHVCGDALIYSRFVSGLKRADSAWSRVLGTFLHVLFHAAFVFLFLWHVPFRARLLACLYVFGVHFLIDIARVLAERKLYASQDIIIFSKKDVLRFLAGRAREPVNVFFRKNMKTWVGMNLLDQGLHLASFLVFVLGIYPRLL
jgi:hypothetical protein